MSSSILFHWHNTTAGVQNAEITKKENCSLMPPSATTVSSKKAQILGVVVAGPCSFSEIHLSTASGRGGVVDPVHCQIRSSLSTLVSTFRHHVGDIHRRTRKLITFREVICLKSYVHPVKSFLQCPLLIRQIPRHPTKKSLLSVHLQRRSIL